MHHYGRHYVEESATQARQAALEEYSSSSSAAANTKDEARKQHQEGRPGAVDALPNPTSNVPTEW